MTGKTVKVTTEVPVEEVENFRKWTEERLTRIQTKKVRGKARRRAVKKLIEVHQGQFDTFFREALAKLLEEK